EMMCLITYEEAKDLALCIEAESSDGSMDKRELSNNKLDDIFICYQQSAIDDLDRCYLNESGVKDNDDLDGGYKVINNIINVYSSNNENQECEINKKCRNKSDKVRNSVVEMDNCWLDNLEAEVNRLLLATENNKDCGSTWKIQVDNSDKMDRCTKINDHSIKTIIIKDEENKKIEICRISKRAVSNENVEGIMSQDNDVVDEIEVLKARKYYRTNKMDTCEALH
ncbi:21854_t:CDS:2, partial [Dentiscutata erythropus]